MKTSLPSGYVFRPPVLADAQGVASLIAACDIACYGGTDITAEEVQNYWDESRFDVAQDARIIVTPDGLIVGYEEICPRDDQQLDYDGYVHPRETGRGFGTLLLSWAEERAHERLNEMRADGSVVLHGNTPAVDQNARAMFDTQGFALVRQFWRMEIKIARPPDRPVWPAGIQVRTLQPEQDERIVHATIEEAFADHWGHISRSFEDWMHWIQTNKHDPALTFLALDGDEIAGVAVNRYRDIAWVGQLAVRRPWRKRGLGLALLLHSFNEFYERGDRTVGLSVDSESWTGATRLYEKAGMHVTRRFDMYEKVIRPA
ncbi:MAG TPA: GNAT family N-acetyltransferase [Anaerolineae bacterium]|nr:GNAT family N-acetyltransferase [Anaerolineae bacterium]